MIPVLIRDGWILLVRVHLKTLFSLQRFGSGSFDEGGTRAGETAIKRYLDILFADSCGRLSPSAKISSRPR